MSKFPSKIAVFCNALDSLHPKKDSTLAILLAAQELGLDILTAPISSLCANNKTIFANFSNLHLQENASEIHVQIKQTQNINLSEFDFILMRQDPPVDAAYWHATQLLSLAEQMGIIVVNPTQTLRQFNEKLITLLFPELTPPLFVSSNLNLLKEFIEEQNDVVCKPLHAMGGSGVFHIQKNDPNISEIFQYLTQNAKVPLMAQRYLPEIIQGDKRILILNGKIIPKVLARIPKAGDWRGNLAQGAQGVLQDLTTRDWEIANTIAAFCKQHRLSFVGIDVIGHYLTEINITSPTGIREIQTAFEHSISKNYIEELKEFMKS